MASRQRLRDAVAAGDLGRARHELTSDGADRDERDADLDVLAELAAAGSRPALELLVERTDTLGLARRAVHGILVDETSLEEVAQDTLVAVATSITSYRGQAKFTTWLHTIARRRAADHLRRRRATVPLTEQDVGDAMRISSVIATRQSAWALVERLPSPYREAVVLRDLECESYAEIATRLERNVNTVKSHVARGRALLAGVLDDEAVS